jgi:hypothetical protein
MKRLQITETLEAASVKLRIAAVIAQTQLGICAQPIRGNLSPASEPQALQDVLPVVYPPLQNIWLALSPI